MAKKKTQIETGIVSKNIEKCQKIESWNVLESNVASLVVTECAPYLFLRDNAL